MAPTLQCIFAPVNNQPLSPDPPGSQLCEYFPAGTLENHPYQTLATQPSPVFTLTCHRPPRLAKVLSNSALASNAIASNS